MVRSSVRGVVTGIALGLTLSASAHAVVARDPMCNVWVDEPSITPFLDQVPIEGVVILPFVLTPGEVVGTAPLTGDPVILAQVYDGDGQELPGYVSRTGAALGAGTFGIHAQWVPSRTLVPGARYRLEIDAQNSPDCSPYAHRMATYNFVVAEKTLDERMDDALPDAPDLSLDWVHVDFPPMCCVASDTTRCADPAHCFACTKSMVKLNVVAPIVPAEESAYVLTQLFASSSESPDTSVITNLEPGAAEARAELGLCAGEYCAHWRVTTPLTDTKLESEEQCVPGSEPMITPEEDGAELVMGDPCDPALSGGSFRSALPPTCNAYPEVRWFDDAVEGFVALGLTQTAAEAQARASGTGAFGGTGGSGNASRGGTGGANSGSAEGGTVTTTHSDSSCALPTKRFHGHDARLLLLALPLGALLSRRRRRAQ